MGSSLSLSHSPLVGLWLRPRTHDNEPVGASDERTSFTIRIPPHFPRTMGQGRRAGGNTERDRPILRLAGSARRRGEDENRTTARERGQNGFTKKGGDGRAVRRSQG